MHDAPFYLTFFAVSTLIAQVPEIQDFKELSATVLLGILFWYTLTRVNSGLQKLTEAISDLKTTIKESEVRHEHNIEKE